MGHVFPHFLNHHPWIKMTQGSFLLLLNYSVKMINLRVFLFIFIGEDITLRVSADEISKSGVCRWSRLQNCFGGHHFLFVLKKGKEDGNHHIRFLVAVQLIGTRNQAKNFSYR